MKGLILAGGTGSRLYPLTKSLSKQLLPVYDKPMIYYPLSVLMLAGLREIEIITTSRDQEAFKELLQDGSQWGISLSYRVQEKPVGLAHAFILAEKFISSEPVCLILGDNIFYGQDLSHKLQDASKLNKGACVFGYSVHDPERYGVVSFNKEGVAQTLEEKPERPKSNCAVTGLYFYDNQVVELAKSLSPSKRGELEITDLNRLYLEKGELEVKMLGRGSSWLDTGTHESLLDAGNFVELLQKRQNILVGSVEEVAWRMGFINAKELMALTESLAKTNYGLYLKNLLEGV